MSREDFELDDSLFDDEGDSGAETDFEFGEEGPELGEEFDDGLGDIDEDLGGDLLGEEEEFPDFEEAGAPGGLNPAVVRILYVMTAITILAVVLIVVLLLTRKEEPSSAAIAATQIAQENAASMTAYSVTSTQSAIEQTATAEAQTQAELTAEVTRAAQTQAAEASAAAIAEAATETAAALLTPVEVTPLTSPTPDAFGLTQTAQAQTQAAAIAGTETAMATPEVTEALITQAPSAPEAVAMTATYIWQMLQGTVIAPTASPTPGGGPLPQQATSTPGLAPSGLFGDGVDGGDLGIMVIAAFGLAGVIFGARTLRKANSRKL